MAKKKKSKVVITLNDNPRVNAEKRKMILLNRRDKLFLMDRRKWENSKKRRWRKLVASINLEINEVRKYLSSFNSSFKYNWNDVEALKQQTIK